MRDPEQTVPLKEAHAQFSELVERNAADLLAYIARTIEPKDAAADAFNETCLVAWRRWHRVPENQEGARMWMFVVARNVVRNHRRAWWRRRSHEVSDQWIADSIVVDEDDELSHVRVAVRALPPKYRELVELVHWNDLSIVEAAVALHIGPSTARTRYARAKLRLRAALEAEDT